MTIGSTKDWPIEQARLKAQNYKILVDSGVDPREEVLNREQAAKAKAQESKIAALTVADVWAIYVEERKPHWGKLHYRDHIDKAKTGGLLAFPQFSRHLIMSKLNWRESHEENEVYV
jgi:hypothetical protein